MLHCLHLTIADIPIIFKIVLRDQLKQRSFNQCYVVNRDHEIQTNLGERNLTIEILISHQKIDFTKYTITALLFSSWIPGQNHVQNTQTQANLLSKCSK